MGSESSKVPIKNGRTENIKKLIHGDVKSHQMIIDNGKADYYNIPYDEVIIIRMFPGVFPIIFEKGNYRQHGLISKLNAYLGLEIGIGVKICDGKIVLSCDEKFDIAFEHGSK